jgi:hypothetical protein
MLAAGDGELPPTRPFSPRALSSTRCYRPWAKDQFIIEARKKAFDRPAEALSPVLDRRQATFGSGVADHSDSGLAFSPPPVATKRLTA